MNSYSTSPESNYSIELITDTFILIIDTDEMGSVSVTNSAAETVEMLCNQLDIMNKKIIYRDTMNRYDELCHRDGTFTSYKALTDTQQNFYRNLLQDIDNA